ncbi:MAG: hypothetical protein CMI18_09470 [Opitutaceae bacterium]|nr:hypothetical protein [Opitutaceae bacterium]
MKSAIRNTAWILALMAVVTSNGWDLIIVQSVVWRGMYQNFSEEMSVTEALESAIVEKHPCNIFKYVRSNSLKRA